jgi:hypothetical protein
MTKLISREESLLCSPETGIKWINLSLNEKIDKVKNVLKKENLDKTFEVNLVKNNGHVVLKTEETIPIKFRGILLLELEQKLKLLIDEGITIWLEPVGDKNKLRKLRGVVFENEKKN